MNTEPLTPLEKRIRFSAILSIVALVGTLISLFVDHPLSFIEFAVVGVLLILVSIGYYLLALIKRREKLQRNRASIY